MGRRLTGALLGIALLLLALALAARGAAPVAAAPLPKLAEPKSAHLVLEMTMGGADTTTGETFAMAIHGEGDIDATRRAMRFSYTLQLHTESGGSTPSTEPLTAEVILVDGRMYARDPVTQRWTWLAMPFESASGSLFSTDFSALGGTPPDFVRVGPEQLQGAATTRWHATYDLAELLSDLATEPSAAPLPEMRLEIDYWIGDADRYLHRVAMAMAFAATDADGLGGSFSLTMALSYSNFDRPVQIVAPAGATPAASGDGAGLANGGFLSSSTLPLIGSTSALPGIGGSIAGTFPGSGGATVGRPGGATPSPAAGRGNGGARIGTAEPTATAQAAPTPTRAVSPTTVPATAAPPTIAPTAAIVANAAIPPTVAPQAQTAAAPTAQESPRVAATSSDTLPLVLGMAGIVLLLGLSGGLIVAGRRSQGR